MFNIEEWFKTYVAVVFDGFDFRLTAAGHALFTKPLPTEARPNRRSRDFVVSVSNSVAVALGSATQERRAQIGQQATKFLKRMFASGIELGEAAEEAVRIVLDDDVLDMP